MRNQPLDRKSITLLAHPRSSFWECYRSLLEKLFGIQRRFLCLDTAGRLFYFSFVIVRHGSCDLFPSLHNGVATVPHILLDRKDPLEMMLKTTAIAAALAFTASYMAEDANAGHRHHRKHRSNACCCGGYVAPQVSYNSSGYNSYSSGYGQHSYGYGQTSYGHGQAGYGQTGYGYGQTQYGYGNSVGVGANVGNQGVGVGANVGNQGVRAGANVGNNGVGVGAGANVGGQGAGFGANVGDGGASIGAGAANVDAGVGVDGL